MRKICESIYSILASRVIMLKKIEIKYLLRYLFKHLYYSFINKDLFNNILNLFKNAKLYRKFFDIKINKLDMLKDKKDNKVIKSYILLK